jgi:hypothetical protein
VEEMNNDQQRSIMENAAGMPVEIGFNEAKEILSKLHKLVCENWTYGNEKASWVDENGNEIAFGTKCRYSQVNLWFVGNRKIGHFTNGQKLELNNCYLKVTVVKEEKYE